ncbi:hypothetical protein SAY87_004700 [Trapa incisa]|uniref:Uncharacterized protein n=1 Tax=Trapa incisa TaxID=236973 RepID=A0AAN7PN39_9MYRT|nr:hypothetical protein SAY87_004700 [Trapa incisa]
MENGNKQPPLPLGEDDSSSNHQHEPHSSSTTAFFTPRIEDISSIIGPWNFYREFFVEAKKLWYLASPTIFTSICQYSLNAITQLFAGHVSTLALTVVYIENLVIAGFSFSAWVSCTILKLIGQTENISDAAGMLALWMIPQLFTYAMNFPIAKFLQA